VGPVWPVGPPSSQSLRTARHPPALDRVPGPAHNSTSGSRSPAHRCIGARPRGPPLAPFAPTPAARFSTKVHHRRLVVVPSLVPIHPRVRASARASSAACFPQLLLQPPPPSIIRRDALRLIPRQALPPPPRDPAPHPHPRDPLHVQLLHNLAMPRALQRSGSNSLSALLRAEPPDAAPDANPRDDRRSRLRRRRRRNCLRMPLGAWGAASAPATRWTPPLPLPRVGARRNSTARSRTTTLRCAAVLLIIEESESRR
jgi:hypothetical protein